LAYLAKKIFLLFSQKILAVSGHLKTVFLEKFFLVKNLKILTLATGKKVLTIFWVCRPPFRESGEVEKVLTRHPSTSIGNERYMLYKKTKNKWQDQWPN
jgi:hypothetical protein